MLCVIIITMTIVFFVHAVERLKLSNARIFVMQCSGMINLYLLSSIVKNCNNLNLRQHHLPLTIINSNLTNRGLLL